MDRLAEMEAFATVVDRGGFTDAARLLGVSKSAVSKHVSALEARLGARLLNRTTRRVSPTEIGLVYYDRARRVLNDAGEADALVSALQAPPSGQLRVAVATDFGVTCLAPALGEFLAAYPDLTVNVVLSNRHVELVAEGFDVAIRLGDGEDGAMRARRIAATARRLVAAPAYLAEHGRPARIEDLGDHRLLHFSAQADGNVWNLPAPSGEVRQVRAAAAMTVNDGPSLLEAACAGIGIAYLPSFLYGPALRAGRVEEAMPGLPLDEIGIHAVHPPGRSLQPKLRAFLEFLHDRFGGRDALDW